MLHRPGVTQDLARFIVDTGWSKIPPDIAHEAKRALVNYFAVALAGCRGGPVEIALQSLASFSGREQATVIGRGERVDALSAAFLNAASANVLDFDDTHVPTAIHPTAPVAPALFALAELRPVTGRDLLAAGKGGERLQGDLDRVAAAARERHGEVVHERALGLVRDGSRNIAPTGFDDEARKVLGDAGSVQHGAVPNASTGKPSPDARLCRPADPIVARAGMT